MLVMEGESSRRAAGGLTGLLDLTERQEEEEPGVETAEGMSVLLTKLAPKLRPARVLVSSRPSHRTGNLFSDGKADAEGA
jgi:hypothetical protein